MNRFLTFYYQRIKPYFLDKPLYTEASENPFFILSAGRSGSTLLRKLLLVNTAVNIPPESDDLIPKLTKFYLGNNHKSWENIVEGCIEIFNKEPSSEFWNLIIEKEELKSLCNKDRSLAGIISAIYFLFSKVHQLDNTQWGDKTPFLIFRTSWLNLVYPKAKYIFLIRDGRAVVNSYLKMNKGHTLKKSAVRWLNSILIYEKGLKSLGPQNILLVRYEDLVSNTEEELNKIFLFLDLDIDNSSNIKLFLGDDQLPHHRNIHEQLTQSYINKWQLELSESEIVEVENIVNKKLFQYGYQ